MAPLSSCMLFAFEPRHQNNTNMKKFIVLALVLSTLYCNAQVTDFSSVAPSGQTLYYNITGTNTVEVTSPDWFPRLWRAFVAPTGALIIPDSVTYNNHKYAVTRIAGDAFNKCYGLTSVIIPSTVTTIQNWAFDSCISLTSVVIPDGVTTIQAAFDNCSNLPSVVIPSSVSYISNRAFSGCTHLVSVSVDSNNIYYDSRNNCNAIIHTSTNVLVAGSNNTVIPNTVTAIGGWAFHRRTLMSTIEIPNSVTSIEERAFERCYGLTSLIIGSSVTSIGSWTFEGCNNIQSITMRCNPPLIETNTFDSVPTAIPVYVPCGSITNYQSNARWNRFTNYINNCYVSILVSVTDSTRGRVLGGGIYSVGDTVTLTAVPFYGSRFVGWNNGVHDNPLQFEAVHDLSIVALFEDYCDTLFVHDTTIVNHYIHDTIINTVHDTTVINRYIHDTVINTVHDTIDNYVYDTMWVHDTTIVTDTLWLTDTVFLYDTVIVYDTVYITGVENAEPLDTKIYARDGQIVVEGADGYTVSLYDAVGRHLATKKTLPSGEPCELGVAATGVYLVKVGPYPARRIVVKR